MSGKDYTPLLMGVTWTFTGLSSIFVGARLFCRIHGHNKIGWDDFWAVFSLIMSYAMSITWSVYAGLGGTINIPPSYHTQTRIVFTSWLSQTWCITGIITTKIAVAALIMRIQGPSRFRTKILWTLCSIAAAWAVIQIGFVWGQCSPSAALWDPESHPDAKCWSPMVVVLNGIACSSYWAFVDLCLAAIPVHMVWKLQIPVRRKLAICCLLSTGVFAAAMTIVRTTKLKADLHRTTDSVHQFVLFFIWNVLEVNVLTMSCCVPNLVPLWDLAKKQGFSQYGSRLLSSMRSEKSGSATPSSTLSQRSNTSESMEKSSHSMIGRKGSGFRDDVPSTFKSSVSAEGISTQTGPGIMVTREVNISGSHSNLGQN